ncbi:TATA-binding protein-associated factor 172 [Thecamonas trahens ATCC 50062]|uniref:TATA-binding protein-associated factor 172 n=1 Tax=Thecamonas trahens ATCC 50062 TaxID=461836 RepID=A0A0L0DPY0_THETB|nr:TATA-binding protein-associated factor 172 [Thecamonas trahens ATCC 50062]KNC54357.1 TATA-binding protein-associated factor 172 [Thecamonas trahens ATCC 50062]|eukprot:XP_013753811.1 TATA-binding protein-associated factor 172 [Thecamonas trahens ATCC 50062]
MAETHLDRLLTLLTTGSPLLTSPEWETRTAAGAAMGALAEATPPWNPVIIPPSAAGASSSSVEDRPSADSRLLSFDSFDIDAVLANARPLAGSAGQEYDLDPRSLSANRATRLAAAREALNMRLGLGDSTIGGDMFADMIADDDLEMKATTQPAGSSASSAPAAEEVIADLDGLSARERNQLKRDARRKRARETGAVSSVMAPPTKKTKKLARKRAVAGNKIVVEAVDDDDPAATEWEQYATPEWPFEPLTDELLYDIFNDRWETRHGAAAALRDILKHHAATAGMHNGVSPAANAALHAAWVEDTALRLFCVLLLDRFGDYVSGLVVAPVRETVAQTMGALVAHMVDDNVPRFVSALLALLDHPHWQVRHGGLLGIKYVVLVRMDLVAAWLPLILRPVMRHLSDGEDDVRAVAAQTLAPLASHIVDAFPRLVGPLLSVLWDALLYLDDLTVSTAASLELLAATYAAAPPDSDFKLYNYDETADPAAAAAADIAAAGSAESSHMLHGAPPARLAHLIPRLFPFLRHNDAAVRTATLTTLSTLLSRSSGAWLSAETCMGPLFRLLFQNMLLETKPSLVAASRKLWSALLALDDSAAFIVSVTSPHLLAWTKLLVTPSGTQLDASLLLIPQHSARLRSTAKATREGAKPQPMEVASSSNAPAPAPPSTQPASGLAADPALSSVYGISSRTAGVRMRLNGSAALGLLAAAYAAALPTEANPFVSLLSSLLASQLSVERQAGALILARWAPNTPDLRSPLLDAVLACLGTKASAVPLYGELMLLLERLRAQMGNLVSLFTSHGLPQTKATQALAGAPSAETDVLAAAAYVATTAFAAMDRDMPLTRTGDAAAARTAAQDQLLETIGFLQSLQDKFHLCVQATAAGAAVALAHFPPKLNPLVKALVAAVKKLDVPLLQADAAAHLVALVEAVLPRLPKGPANKICGSMLNALVGDPATVAAADWPEALAGTDREPALLPANLAELNPPKLIGADADRAARAAIGAAAFFHALADSLGASLFSLLPHLETKILAAGLASPATEPQAAVRALALLATLAPKLAVSPEVEAKVASLLPGVFACLVVANAAVRHGASRALAALAGSFTLTVMQTVISSVLPLLDDGTSPLRRLGAAAAVDALVDALGDDVLPYLVFIIVPVLGRMSDPVAAVRTAMANTFGSLIKLMPLEAGAPSPAGMSAELVAQRSAKRSFLDQLLDPTKLEPYELPFTLKGGITLRSYQQDGLNWLAFLRKYALHGVLCDDMGLGKTLQTIAIVAASAVEAAAAPHATPASLGLPTLVVAPTTLVEHWAMEMTKFVPDGILCPIAFRGPPKKRLEALRGWVTGVDAYAAWIKAVRKAGKSAKGAKGGKGEPAVGALPPPPPPPLAWAPREQRPSQALPVVVCSYEVMRNDVELLSQLPFGYCVLDEGHVIKNPKSLVAQAVKRVPASHRLILSGTPIQNNVLELWSLFDFLMPGFLWSEGRFQAVYGKPIVASRDAKCSEAEQEAGALALEALHRQVLPFLMRRLKEEVLDDLPPKIIQDVYCTLSPLQRELYAAVDEVGLGGKGASSKVHIFRTLQYLRKVINHPTLALTPSHGMYAEVMGRYAQPDKALHTLAQAPKLKVLAELLEQCGITGAPETRTGGGGHRVLIFAQSKALLDLIESDVFESVLPGVTYMRLDGSVASSKRQAVVNKFNSDPTIDVLLLTTSVGGLGLNLTGADTVVFMDHDWNPMKDLQAMDRAHRLGQKRVVNVYRLIAKGTLEDKIMGLQQFKLNVANTVVSSENSSMLTMSTDRLIDLFELGDDAESGAAAGSAAPESAAAAAAAESAAGSSGQGGKLGAILNSLGELWDDGEYQDQFDLGAFLESMPTKE